ncbi:MAG: alpha/beta hydrolase [Pseudonocardiaceae bacterium]
MTCKVMRHWFLLVIAVLLGVGVGGCGTPSRGSVSEPIPALAGVHPCDPAALGATASDAGAGGVFRGPGGVTFSCATLSVPLDHAGLRGTPQQRRQLSLQVAMADNTTAPRGVLVWLVGGPGAPGVGLTAVIAHQFDPAVLRDYRLVLFSARGTGAGALQCPQLQQVMDDQSAPPSSAVQACAQSIGADRRFYTTADTIADLDTLRHALGVDKLTLNGASYGTFVAERYAITHPDRVSRLVLDSVVPHDSYDPLEITALNRTADVLRMVCADIRCGTDPAQDLSQVIVIRHDGPRLLEILSGLTHGAPRLSGVPAALHEVARGEHSALDAIIAAEGSEQASSAEIFSQGLHAATVCADWVWPWGDAQTPVPGRADATAQALATLPDAMVFPYDRATAAGSGIVVTCEQWPPTPVVGFPSGTDLPPVPTLLLAGDRDLITPLAWAQHEAAHAPRGRLVVIPGAGHITQNRGNGAAGRAAVTEFLTGP